MKGDARYIERGGTKNLQFKCTKGGAIFFTIATKVQL